jgi:hypothetical protein
MGKLANGTQYNTYGDHRHMHRHNLTAPAVQAAIKTTNPMRPSIQYEMRRMLLHTNKVHTHETIQYQSTSFMEINISTITK